MNKNYGEAFARTLAFQHTARKTEIFLCFYPKSITFYKLIPQLDHLLIPKDENLASTSAHIVPKYNGPGTLIVL